MGGQTAVLLSLVGSRRSGLCLAMGRRGVVHLRSRNGQRGGDRRISPQANIADADPWRDRNEQALVGGELSTDAGDVRAACTNDEISVRQPAVTCRLRLVRAAQRNGDRSDANAN